MIETFSFIDIIQMVIRKIAGLPAYTVNGERTYNYIDSAGNERYDDLVMSFLESETVHAVFLSILIAAVFLLFIATFIAVLKTEFDTKNSNAKGPIFANAIKSIAYFAMVPIICMLGIVVANVVLRTLDGATSRNAQSFSSQIFVAGGMEANRARTSMDFAKKVHSDGIVPGVSLIQYDGDTREFQEQVAMAIDAAFRSNATPLNTGDVGYASVKVNNGLNDVTVNYSSFDVKNYNLVYYYYDTLGYNYLIGFAAGVVIAGLLLNLTIGVIRRVYELVILFVVSPAVVALMPLDNGDKFKTWKTSFIKRVFSAYGPIIGLNLVFMILELMQGITLF